MAVAQVAVMAVADAQVATVAAIARAGVTVDVPVAGVTVADPVVGGHTAPVAAGQVDINNLTPHCDTFLFANMFFCFAQNVARISKLHVQGIVAL